MHVRGRGTEDRGLKLNMREKKIFEKENQGEPGEAEGEEERQRQRE